MGCGQVADTSAAARQYLIASVFVLERAMLTDRAVLNNGRSCEMDSVNEVVKTSQTPGPAPLALWLGSVPTPIARPHQHRHHLPPAIWARPLPVQPPLHLRAVTDAVSLLPPRLGCAATGHSHTCAFRKLPLCSSYRAFISLAQAKFSFPVADCQSRAFGHFKPAGTIHIKHARVKIPTSSGINSSFFGWLGCRRIAVHFLIETDRR